MVHSYTIDKEISRSMSDFSLELSENKLPHYNKPMEMRLPSKEELFLVNEIKRLLQKRVVKESQHEKGEFISLNFLVPKSEDFVSIIVNLKSLNENMTYPVGIYLLKVNNGNTRTRCI